VTRASLVSLDGKGRVLAMVGGLNYDASTWNLAVQAERQAASTAKVATYLAALEAGFTPDSPVQDSRDAIAGRFVPRNADHVYKGRIPLRQCLRESRNVCTYWLAQQVGFDAVAEMAERIGLTAGRAPGASVVLGASETTLMRNTAAYAAIAHGGRHHAPHVLRGVLAHGGTVPWRHDPGEGSEVLSPEVAATMADLLRSVASVGGTGGNAVFRGGVAHGKTGTSQENRDAWFVGFTDAGVATGIWVGPAEGGRMDEVAGGDLPARIFAFFNVNLVERFEGYMEARPPDSTAYWRDVNLP
jgi:penicillin-binding protein 1A